MKRHLVIPACVAALLSVTVTADEVDDKFDELASEIERVSSTLTRVAARIGSDYDDEDVIPRDRDRRYFRDDMVSLSNQVATELQSLRLKLSELEEAVTEQNPCEGIPPTTECSECRYPGVKECRVIDCQGTVINTRQDSCSLDPSLFSCGTCYNTRYVRPHFYYAYDLRYNGIAVATIERRSSALCLQARDGDTRCQ